jgi:putative ABC transport system ATP-binding protein
MQADPDSATWAARAYGATKVYGTGDAEIRALDDVTVGFQRGRFTAVMGPSGSGKSTLMQCMAGLDWVTSGRVFIGDMEIQGLDPTAITKVRRDHIGFIFQAFNLVPSLTARKNILLPLVLAKRPVDQAWFDTVVDVLGLGDRLGHRPRELSGGQQQRVAVARALISRPDLIMADEPTGNLDSRSSAELLDLIRRSVDDAGQTVVMVTHDPVAAAYADRVVFLVDGRIVDDVDRPGKEWIIERMATLRPAAPALGGA